MRRKFKTTFPLKLKLLRTESGKSQTELARELGITRSCLANYEAGKRQPDNDMLIKIADSFHVLTDYLMDRSEFRHLDLTTYEIEECIRVKRMLQETGDSLDISNLCLENRLPIYEYYDHICTTNRARKQQDCVFSITL